MKPPVFKHLRGFSRWLYQRRNEENPVGDVARDAISDDEYPWDQGAWAAWAYLGRGHSWGWPCPEAVDALQEGIRAYWQHVHTARVRRTRRV